MTIQLDKVPDYRLWLLDTWRPGGMYERGLLAAGRRGGSSLLDWMHWTPEEIQSERFTLQHGALFWLTPDFQKLMDACAPTLPDEMRLEADIPPPQGFGAGLVVLSEPMVCPDYRNPERDIVIESFTYQPILRLRPGTSVQKLTIGPEELHETMVRDNVVTYLRLVFYGTSRINPRMVELMGVAEWETGKPIVHCRRDLDEWSDSRVLADIEFDRRRFAAFSLLANQTITETDEHHGARCVRRRCERADVPSTVQVVRLRRVTGSRPEAIGEDVVEWSHQWIVSGHWRHQACGPEHSERRWKFIAPYVKGPEDKPLILKERVYAAVR